MSVAKQLYQLQEVDLEIDSQEQALVQGTSQLGESPALTTARQKLALEQQHQAGLQKEQRSLEWEIDDISGKLTAAESKLYGSQIHNPKELTNLQHETDGLKTRRQQLEDKELQVMEQVELATRSLATLGSEFKTIETEWQSQQQQLTARLEQIKTALSDLKQKRQLLAAEIDSKATEIYQQIRKQKGTAVARVEQGICRGCRISLPVSELQRARGGGLVRCSSCGRILFLA